MRKEEKEIGSGSKSVAEGAKSVIEGAAYRLFRFRSLPAQLFLALSALTKKAR